MAASICLALAKLTVSSCVPLIIFFCATKEQLAAVASCIPLLYEAADWLEAPAAGIHRRDIRRTNRLQRLSDKELIQIVSNAHCAQLRTSI